MKPENPNPNNSSLVQVLLDARQTAPPEKRDVIDAALRAVESDRKWQKDTETVFKRHAYGGKQHFVRVPLFDNSSAVMSLTGNQLKVLEALCRCMTGNYLVQISMDMLVTATGIGSKHTINDALDHLDENGFMAALPDTGKGGRGGGGAAIYMINPRICGTGKVENMDYEQTKFNDLAGELRLVRFESLQSTHRFIPTIATVPYKGKKITVNTLSDSEKYLHKKEKALPEGQSDSATEGNIDNNFPVNNITRLGPKCQPIKNDEPFLDVTYDEDDDENFPF